MRSNPDLAQIPMNNTSYYNILPSNPGCSHNKGDQSDFINCPQTYEWESRLNCPLASTCKCGYNPKELNGSAFTPYQNAPKIGSYKACFRKNTLQGRYPTIDKVCALRKVMFTNNNNLSTNKDPAATISSTRGLDTIQEYLQALIIEVLICPDNINKKCVFHCIIIQEVLLLI